MQDFFGRGLRGQEAVSRPEPYQLYRRDQNLLPETQSVIRDFEYFKSMYPSGARRLQQYVEEVCDEMEYEGSPIFDEYPDRILIEQMLQKISLKAAALQMQEPEAAAWLPGAQTGAPEWLQPAGAVSPDLQQPAPAQHQPSGESRIPPAAVMPEMQPSAAPEPPSAALQEENPPAGPANYSSEETHIQELKPGQNPAYVRVSYGPLRGECRKVPEGYQTWETTPVKIQEARDVRAQDAPGPRRGPWGPPPPPGPWGPPPPPGPWGPPPPPPGPWGPPRPPQGPWGPPPPPGPWGPPPPPPRPGKPNFLGDLLSVLLFNELQGRRCRSGRCR